MSMNLILSKTRVNELQSMDYRFDTIRTCDGRIDIIIAVAKAALTIAVRF